MTFQKLRKVFSYGSFWQVREIFVKNATKSNTIDSVFARVYSCICKSKIFFAPFLHKYIEYRIIMLIIAKIRQLLRFRFWQFSQFEWIKLNIRKVFKKISKHSKLYFHELFFVQVEAAFVATFFLFFNRELTISEIDPLSPYRSRYHGSRNFFVVSRSKWEISLRWRLNHARLIFPPWRVILPSLEEEHFRGFFKKGATNSSM